MGGERKTLNVTLIEKDGSSWRMAASAAARWSEASLPLRQLRHSRSIFIPSPYPGVWNYWRVGPATRGGAGDQGNIENVERLELSVGANAGEAAGDDGRGVAVESVWLSFECAAKP